MRLQEKYMRREIHNALITGPTGAIGTALCSELIKRGVEVYAVCRPGSKRINVINESDHLHVIFCDLNNICHLPKFVGKTRIDVFYHLAWANTSGSGRNDMESQINNIRGTIEAVRVAAELNSKVFVGVGSQAECGRVDGLIKPDTPCFPENGYGMAKLCAGEMSRVECHKFGIDHIWMRVLSIYGPHDGRNSLPMKVISDVAEGKNPKCTKGDQLWDYLYSGDAAVALALAAEDGKDGSIYPLGSGMALPLRNYIEQIRDTVNPLQGINFGAIPYYENQVMHLQADISSLRYDTGFEPKMDFCEGIRITYNSFLKEHNYHE